ALLECGIKKSKVIQAQEDVKASEYTRDEAKERYATQLKLRNSGRLNTSDEDVRAAKLAWDKYVYEARVKKEVIISAEQEYTQALTLLQMHEIRSKIPGKIKVIYKLPGEAVKSLDPVFQIQNYERLRVEAKVDVQYRGLLRPEMPVVIEASQQDSPLRTLIG